MPAIAPFTVTATGAGVLMSDVGLRGDEDYLLIDEVTDTAEYSQEITRFNEAGRKIYHALQDPFLRFSFTGKCLAFRGLANAHPGQAVTADDLENIMPGAFGWQFMAAGSYPLYFYRRPVRRRISADLADLSFDVEVHPGNGTLVTPATLAWDPPQATLQVSAPPLADTPPPEGTTHAWIAQLQGGPGDGGGGAYVPGGYETNYAAITETPTHVFEFCGLLATGGEPDPLIYGYNWIGPKRVISVYDYDAASYLSNDAPP